MKKIIDTYTTFLSIEDVKELSNRPEGISLFEKDGKKFACIKILDFRFLLTSSAVFTAAPRNAEDAAMRGRKILLTNYWDLPNSKELSFFSVFFDRINDFLFDNGMDCMNAHFLGGWKDDILWVYDSWCKSYHCVFKGAGLEVFKHAPEFNHIFFRGIFRF